MRCIQMRTTYFQLNSRHCNAIESQEFRKAADFAQMRKDISNRLYGVQVMIKYVKIDLCAEFIPLMCLSPSLFLFLFLFWSIIRLCSFKSGLVIRFNLFDDCDWQNVGTLNAGAPEQIVNPKGPKCICTLAAQPELKVWIPYI